MLKSPASDAYLVNRDESRGSFAGITSRPHPPLYSGRHSASTTQQQLRPQNSLIEVMPQQIIGSRALSNHILWRTAYRRDHHSMPYSSSSAQLALGEAGKSSTHIDLAESKFLILA
jgi:hypothetical protein